MLAALATTAAMFVGAAAQAAPVSYELEVTVTTTGPFSGRSITGTIGWDTDDVVDPVTFLIPPDLSIEFAHGGVTIDETNDVHYPDFPEFQFFGGVLEFIDFVLVDGVNGVSLPGGVLWAELNDDLAFDGTKYTVGASAYTTQYDFPEVPLPAGLPLLIGGLGAFGLLRARRG
ncbi:hypothetical protein OB2597_02212 [Pseudooceanicola batsensis HTCC2597]|uniref:Uncharacterized protein n=1 Tax=Pseudooceanicola batsensis (strain ATCC BAA-863 / DSM 15984 / KCTC 12145 / HTCC2597) TaxID=252305 RepID=A3TX36_PSEBH|nr:hypothetical protein OB2597_02212 [Pseudooceanicola batsensis HTCC2597]